MFAARSFLRSGVGQAAVAALRSTKPTPSSTRSLFTMPKQSPLSHRVFRSPVELSCCVETMLPYHTAIASSPFLNLMVLVPRRSIWTHHDIPNRTRFPKQHRGRLRGISFRGNRISFGRYALQTLEPAWISSRQIQAGRLAMTRNVPRGGKMWVRMFPDKPVTARPAEMRMGHGKGSTEYWVAVVKPGKVLYELGGVPESIARKALSIVASKMPIKTQFIVSK